MVLCPFIFIFIFILFCVEATFGQDTYDTVMVIISEVLLWKLLYHSYVKVSSQELRDTLLTVF